MPHKFVKASLLQRSNPHGSKVKLLCVLSGGWLAHEDRSVCKIPSPARFLALRHTPIPRNVFSHVRSSGLTIPIYKVMKGFP